MKGDCPQQIATRFNYGTKNLRSDLSKSIYRYVAVLTQQKIGNWAQVRLYLERSGYRKQAASSPEMIEIQIKIPRDIDPQSVQLILDTLKQACDSKTLTLEKTYKE